MKNILVMEDDQELAEGIALAVQEESLFITTCFTIKEAKEEIQKKKFDLLILDINMPDGSGLELCKQIRKSDKVAIMLLTAKDMELDIVTGFEVGADDYITKPFSLLVLRARIRALLRRTVNDTKQEYEKGPFLFQFSTMNFYKNNSKVELSKTEQKILSVLVFHENQIVTRDYLMESVWPEGTEYVEDNALSVGIRRLREKLEDRSSRPRYINTLYGKGYKWVNPV